MIARSIAVGAVAAALALGTAGLADAEEPAPAPSDSSVVLTPSEQPVPDDPAANPTPAETPAMSAVVRTDDGSLKVTTAPTEELLAQRTAGEQVLAVDATSKRYAAAMPTEDPGRDLQWGLNRLQAEDIWHRSTGEGVTVAVIDTGVKASHPDLRGRVIGGYNALTRKKGKPEDNNGHGTFLAGMISGTVNGSGIEGLAPNARIMPIKVLDSDGIGDSDDIARGIIWAVDHGADVINMSFAADTSNTVEAEAVDYARGAGVAMVAAGGNEGMKLSMYPAAYPGVLGVGAVDFDNNRATFSNSGPHIDVVAPGQGIVSSSIKRKYTWQSGTSMSTAYVSALAALAASYAPGAGGEPLLQQIIATARDIGPAGADSETGAGMVDPASLFEQLGSGRAPGMPRDLAANGTSDGKIRLTFTAPAGKDYYVQFKGGRKAPGSVNSGYRVAAGQGAGQPVTVELSGKKTGKAYAFAVFTTQPGETSRSIAVVRPLNWTLTPTRSVPRGSTQRLQVGAKVKGFGWIGGYRLLMTTQQGGTAEKSRKFVPSPEGPASFIVRDLDWSFHYQFTLLAPGFWNAASPRNSQYVDTSVSAKRGKRITGKVSPNHAPSDVLLQRKAGKKWKTIDTAKTNGNGAFAFASKPGTLRVYAPADLWRGPASTNL